MTNIPNETYIEYHKRFANGEQYIEIDANGEIVEIAKDYYWQEREVYNHLAVIVERYKTLGDEFLYGKDGLVSRLLPFQRAYNAIKNRELEYINRITMGVLCVEDGSIDTDNIEKEGIYGGKVIVYRQGANAPSFSNDELHTQSYIDGAKNFKQEMYEMAQRFAQTRLDNLDSVRRIARNRGYDD